MKKSMLSLALLSSLLTGYSQAADVNLSGYGSIRGGQFLDEQQPPIYSYSDEIDFENESIFALQASSRLNDKWSATILMQAAGKNEFEIKARWAYVNYQVTPETTVTFGRFALPYFKSSDTKDIGFSHNYSRMPNAVYRDYDFSAVEGLRLTHSTYLGDADLVFKASFASWDGDVEVGKGFFVPSKLSNIMQLSVNYNWEWLTLFAGGFVGDWSSDAKSSIDNLVVGAMNDIAGANGLPSYTIENNGLYDFLGNYSYDLNELYVEEDTMEYYSLGASIDYQNVLVDAEYSSIAINNSIDSQDDVFFVSVGYRINDWVISLVTQQRKGDYDKSQLDSVNDQFGIVEFVVEATSQFTALEESFKANGIHIRYEAAHGVAYKFEYSVIDDLSILNDGQNERRETEKVGLVTFGVDFVF